MLFFYFNKRVITSLRGLNTNVSKSNGFGIDFPNPTVILIPTPIARKIENTSNSFLYFFSKRGGTSIHRMIAAIRSIPILFIMII
jgi:hypothetical protein